MTTPQPIGTPDWGTHTALIREQVVNISTAMRIGPGASQLVSVPLKQTAYAIFASALNFTGNANSIPLQFDLQWLDSTGSPELGRQRWWFYAGTGASPHVVTGHGPNETGTFALTITNRHATDTASVTVNVADVSQAWLLHDWRTDDTTSPAFPTFTLATSDLAAGVLADLNNISVPASSSLFFLLPLYAGKVAVKQFGSAQNGMDLLINLSAIQPAARQNGIFEQISAVGAVGYARASLPQVQCLVQLKNTSAGGPTTSFSEITVYS